MWVAARSSTRRTSTRWSSTPTCAACPTCTPPAGRRTTSVRKVVGPREERGPTTFQIHACRLHDEPGVLAGEQRGQVGSAGLLGAGDLLGQHVVVGGSAHRAEDAERRVPQVGP